MNNLKYIFSFLILSFLFDGVIDLQAQRMNIKASKDSVTSITRFRTKDGPRDKYVVSSGDTTLIVNRISTGLDGADADFLFRDSRFLGMDIYKTDETRYNTLEEATYDINRLMRVLEQDKIDVKDGNRSLSYRASQVERMKIRKEEKSKSLRDSLLAVGDVKKLAELDAKFGKQPTYYLNGIEVPYRAIELLFPDEILSREIKVTNTASGNPNGEVWYKVPDRVLLEIGVVIIDVEPETKEEKKQEALDYINIK